MAYICVHVYTCIHIYANTYTYGCDTYKYIQIHTYTYTYIHIHAMTWAGTLTHILHAACRYTLDTCTYMHIYTHTYTHTYIYIHIHTHTYPLKFSVSRGFCAAAANARDSYAQRRLPRSARTGLRTGSSSTHCDWRAHGLCRGAALAPPTRAARTGAPKRVWEWVPDRGIKWRGCCPWLS